MAIENTYLAGKNITLGCGFDLQAKAPLDSRQTVPAFAGLQALIDGNAAYEGMIVYDEETKKTYQAQLVDGILAFREFGINEAELKDLIASETTAAMEFKGVTATLPENPSKGDMYKVAGENISIKIDNVDAKLGDSIVYNGEQWFLIPSGDDIEDTWRPVTDVDNDSTLTFVAGDKLEKTVAADGTITYKHVEIDAPTATPVGEDEQTRTYIASIETDGHGHITGYKTATENVEDTNTEYTFEGQSDEATSVYFQVTSNEEGASAEVVYLDAYSKNEADGKFVDIETWDNRAVSGENRIAAVEKTLETIGDASTGILGGLNTSIGDIYDKIQSENGIEARLDALDGEDGAVPVAQKAIEALEEAVEDLEAYVGTIPTDEKYADVTNVISYVNKKAEETLAAAQGGSSETAASVKQQLDNYKSENDTRVKAAEDAIADIEADYLKAADKTELSNAIAGKVDNTTYAADKATFAIAETVNAALDLKANVADVVANDTFESFKTANTTAIGEARTGAVADIEAKGYAVATDVAGTYATKTELGNVDKKFADYVTSASYTTDKAAINKAIEDEAKARDDADKAFETRIAALEGNFGDGEGTVEAQIEAAVAVEKQRAEGIEGGLRTDVDAVAGRMTTAESKITALETESAKHAIKTEVESALTLKADKSALEATDKTLADVKTTVDNFFAEDAAINDTIDTLKEIANYIATDKEGAADITARVGAIEGKVDVEKVSTAISDAVKVETDRATGAESVLSSRLDTLEAAKDNYVAADTTLKTELQAEIDADVKVVNDALEAYKTSNDAEVAKKANADDVYTKTQVYTQAEVDALIATAHTWGEF